MEHSAEIRVLAFGSAAAVLGWSQRTVRVAPGTRLAELTDRLEAENPRLAEARGRIRYAVNCAYADPQTVLRPGDEVALIPPVSGG